MVAIWVQSSDLPILTFPQDQHLETKETMTSGGFPKAAPCSMK